MQPPSACDLSEPSASPIILVGNSVRAAAMDTADSGARVIAIDRFGDLDLLAACRHWRLYDDQARWLDEMNAIAPSVLVPVGGFEWPVDTGFTRLCQSHLIAYPAPAVLERVRDPGCLSLVARQVGVAFPDTCYQPPSKGDNRTWLVKRRRSGGGVGIHVATPADTAQPDHYFQRRIPGQVVGANFIAVPNSISSIATAHFLGLYAGITYRRNPSHPFLYGGSYGPLQLCGRVMQQIQSLGQCIATEFSLLGLFNVDLIVNSQGEVTLLEINPRYSASMELIRHTCHSAPYLIDWHVQSYQRSPGIEPVVASFAESVSRLANTGFACKRIHYFSESSARARQLIQSLSLATAPAHQDVIREKPLPTPERLAVTTTMTQSHAAYDCVSAQLLDIPQVPTATNPGEPICTSLASGRWADRVKIQRATQTASPRLSNGERGS